LSFKAIIPEVKSVSPIFKPLKTNTDLSVLEAVSILISFAKPWLETYTFLPLCIGIIASEGMTMASLMAASGK